MSKTISLLLWLANKLNKDPFFYGAVNNVDNYSRQFLDGSAEQQPHIGLKEFMAQMSRMDNCENNCVIKNGIVYKDIDLSDEIRALK